MYQKRTISVLLRTIRRGFDPGLPDLRGFQNFVSLRIIFNFSTTNARYQLFTLF